MNQIEWDYISNLAKIVLKSTTNKRILNLEDKIEDLTILYFEHKDSIYNPFAWLWSASKNIYRKSEQSLIGNESVDSNNYLPPIWSLNRFQSSIPLSQLVLCTIDITNFDEIERVENLLSKYIKKRTIFASQSAISPYHSNLPIKEWIDLSLYDFKLKPYYQYNVYSFGFSTDQIDPKDFNYYRSDKLMEIVEYDA